MHKFFQGIYTAIPTPFLNGQLDLPSLEKMVNFQATSKVVGIVVAGSTGESASLTNDEYLSIIEQVISCNNTGLQVIAGISTNDTAQAIRLGHIAAELGADGVMCVTPYYNKPSQIGLVKHFTAIHDAVNIPIMLYSVPSRTGIDFTDSTIIELAKLPNILGLKDAANDIARPLRLKKALKEEFSCLAGNDLTALAYNANGGVGCVSVASNIVPKLCKTIQDLTLQGDYIAAREIHLALAELFDTIFVEVNPVPVKYALSLLNLCKAEVRLPLCQLSDTNKKLIESLIVKIKLNLDDAKFIQKKHCSKS